MRVTPPQRKHGLKIWRPVNRGHAKCPLHREMNGVSVRGLKRSLITNKCDTSCLLPCQSWNWSYLRSVPSINLHSHIRPPLRDSDKPSPKSKSTYSKTTHWLQQSQKSIDHFWKKDTALVKALRQYHFTSNVLEGRTQWRFQKSRILHKVLDVIAINMESTGTCLDFCDSTPMDQEFRR